MFSNYFYYRSHDWALFIMVCEWDRNPEISLSSRNNPEMSQHSSDLPMLVNFSIYIFPWDLVSNELYRWWGFWAKKNWYFIDFHWSQKLLTNRKCQNQLMFLQGAYYIDLITWQLSIQSKYIWSSCIYWQVETERFLLSNGFTLGRKVQWMQWRWNWNWRQFVHVKTYEVIYTFQWRIGTLTSK